MRSHDFRAASPGEVLVALVPEERAEFERQWCRAVEIGDPVEVSGVLDSGRRRAVLASQLGHDGYRRMLERAEHTLRTGESIAGAVSWDDLKVELGLSR